MKSRPSGKSRRTTARRQRARHQLGRIRQHLEKGNILLEVRDARAPRSTDPARLVRMPEGRVRCLVLTKTDLADPDTTAAWMRHFEREGRRCLALDQGRTKKAKKLLTRLLDEASKQAKSFLGVGRAVVLGLPNVGKSTLINRLLGRGALRTGDRPGVTKGESWCKIHESLYLLDTPGVIEAMNRLVDADEDDMAMALLRVAPASLLDPVAAARGLMERAGEHLRLPEAVAGLPPGEVLEALAMRWGRLGPDGKPALQQTAQQALRELSAGNWGRFSLEHPDDAPEPEPAAEDEPAP